MQEVQETHVQSLGREDPLEKANPMDRGAWGVTVHGVSGSQTWLSTHTHTQRTVTTETVAENCSGVRKEAQDYKAEGQGFPGGSVAKNPPAKAGGTGLITVHGDPTWHGAAKPTPHNHGACSLEPGSRNCWILHALKPTIHNRRSHCSGKPKYQNWRKAQQRRPNTAKNKLNKNYLKK